MICGGFFHKRYNSPFYRRWLHSLRRIFWCQKVYIANVSRLAALAQKIIFQRFSTLMEWLHKGHFTYFELFWMIQQPRREGWRWCPRSRSANAWTPPRPGPGSLQDEHRHRHRYRYTKSKSTWIIALAMSTRRRIFLVFMALSIGCYCQFITSSRQIMTSNLFMTRE